MGFARQYYWVGCHFPLQGIFLTQGSNPHLLYWQVDSLPLRHPRSHIRLLLLFSHSVMSDSLWPHGLQHARLPGPSPSPRVCTRTCPLNAIQPSLSSPSTTFNLSQLQGLFHWVNSSHQVTKILELQLQHQPYQWIFSIDYKENKTKVRSFVYLWLQRLWHRIINCYNERTKDLWRIFSSI